MRDWISRAARLYPRHWRERYGEEFDALLDDANAGPRELWDVIKGALTMQWLARNYWRLAVITALAGTIIAGAISLRLPDRYIASAAVNVGPDTFAENQLQRTLSVSSLVEIIQRPSLDLYRGERSRVPMADVIEQMRNHDIRVQKLGDAWTFSFAYPDRDKARAVTRALVTRFADSNRSAEQLRSQAWREIWPQAAAPAAIAIQVLETESLSDDPVSPNRFAFVATGTGLGLLLGLLAAGIRRRPRPAARMAAFAAAGCALGVAVAFLLPVRYVSTAVLMFTPPVIPDTPTGSASAPLLTEILPPMERQILQRSSLAALVQQPSLNLYPELRATKPLEEVLERMRNRDLRIRTVGPSAFEISFAYGDAEKAQKVVREIVSQFVEQNLTAALARTRDRKEDDPLVRIQERRLGTNLEVLDAASFPQSPVAPNRSLIAMLGIALGLLLGALTLKLSARSTPPPSPESC